MLTVLTTIQYCGYKIENDCLLPPHIFPLLYGVDVSDAFSQPGFAYARRIVHSSSIPHLHSPPLRSSFLLPIHTHPRLSFTHLFLISFHDMAVSSYTFLNISPTFVVHLIISILVLYTFVIPHINLNILISATSNYFCCAFFATHGSALYTIAGRKTMLYTLVYLPFLYTLIFLSRNPQHPLVTSPS